jgi:glycosyltransferase involved in cell wall biosynthesis
MTTPTTSHIYERRDNVVPRQAPPPAPVEPVPAEERLRIAMLAPPWIPVPPPGYGGTEEVVALVTDALVARGHDVELFCAPGSSSKARVRPLLEAAHPESIERALFEADHVGLAFDQIDEAASARHPFDVVHDHSGFTATAMANRIATPLVHTVHLPFNDETVPFYSRHGAKASLVAISHAQAGRAPDGVEIAAVVHNPIDVDSWPVGYQKEDYLLWVGRFVAEKGPQRAIQVARESGRRLIIAGVVQPGQERFFSTEIQPYLDGDRIVYVGEVGGARKQYLFANAYAFLMPIRWAEPFGMVMVESLAAGTPVLAFPEGAAPEIVEHGETGFLVNDEHEMALMVDKAGSIDPARCRRGAERFSPDKVAARYEAAYRGAIERRGRRPGVPAAAHASA